MFAENDQLLSNVVWCSGTQAYIHKNLTLATKQASLNLSSKLFKEEKIMLFGLVVDT